ncbi:hypothetical protein AQUCO_02000045v1 [Aquilegia coerulea]|uniref:Uncharacterized protein n=1 Tax=Aquilegia coerulea TaxID=218851 RepID=A0A2G5DFN4_AQUCA|nr:hypothetical protein AQUCO_02000045v1 [Aquilegia coerulea]
MQHFLQAEIYGLKTLIKGFLPYQGTHVRHQINELFIILSKILPEGKFSDDSISSICYLYNGGREWLLI